MGITGSELRLHSRSIRYSYAGTEEGDEEMTMNYQEIRIVALQEAVKVSTKAPIFKGDASTAEIVDYTVDDVLKIATSFEVYIIRGE